MKIVVIGGTGVIGTKLVKSLSEIGHENMTTGKLLPKAMPLTMAQN